MSAFEIVNWGEVILWPTIGAVCLIFAIKGKGRAGRSLWILAPTFVLFGVSDYIELQTGAWWKPLGLLFLKAACIAVFAGAAHRHYRKYMPSKTTKASEGNSEVEPETQALGKGDGANKKLDAKSRKPS